MLCCKDHNGFRGGGGFRDAESVSPVRSNLLSGYSTFSALAHLLHKSTSCCHDGDRFHTNALSTSRFVYTCINFPVLVAKSCMCFVFTHP